MLAERLRIGDYIGVFAPSLPIYGKYIDELNQAKTIIENLGFKVKFSKNIFNNTYLYANDPKQKAEDFNELVLDPDVKMIWCARGGATTSTMLPYIDYEAVKQHPKIICGYSDITALTQVIHDRTGLVTFSGTNFKTIATDETTFSLYDALNKFTKGEIAKNGKVDIILDEQEHQDKLAEQQKDSLKLGLQEEYEVVAPGVVEAEMIGGNLSLTTIVSTGKFGISFKDKILFIEELGQESQAPVAYMYLNFLKQNGVFDQIKGLWIGSYECEGNFNLVQIVKDVLGNEYSFPIIHSDNFGHIEKKICIPVGARVRVDTNAEYKIQLLEDVVN